MQICGRLRCAGLQVPFKNTRISHWRSGSATLLRYRKEKLTDPSITKKKEREEERIS